MRPTSLAKDLVLQFLQDFFAEPELLDTKNPYLWSPEPEKSRILICDGYTEDLEKAEARPAIVLRRGGLQAALGQFAQRLSYDWKTDESESMNLFVADLTAECLARNGLEAEYLADIVHQGLLFFNRIARQRGAFEVKQLVTGPESLIMSDSQQELSAVPVGMVISFMSKWRFTPTQNLLEKIKVTLDNSRTLKEIETVEVSNAAPQTEGS